jgi:hypothetical protein
MLSPRLFSIGTFAFAAFFACPATVLAQPPSSIPAAPIEQQMTSGEFKAAGLDKLSATELANLNSWLNHAIVTETAKAAEFATQKIKKENRGFFSFGSEEPIVGRIVGEFRGFDRGRTYTLENGQVWKQIDDASLVGVRLTNPEVRIRPSKVGNTWYMTVGHYGTNARVERVK